MGERERDRKTEIHTHTELVLHKQYRIIVNTSLYDKTLEVSPGLCETYGEFVFHLNPQQ